MQYSQRAQAISPFYAMEIGEQAAKLEAQGTHVVKLNLGEPDFGAPPDVLKTMAELANNRSFPYTSALGMPELRSAIAGFYQTQHQIDIDPQRVIVTSGASAALLLLSAALVDDNTQVMMADPSYPCNRQFIQSFGGKVQLIATNATDNFQLNSALVKQHWQPNTKGIMLATPSNPTGTSIETNELADICEFAQSQGAWSIIDEIYLNLHHQQQQPTTALAFDNDAFIVNSFSKYFGMTGWRLGWCVVPEHAVSILEKLAQNYYICPSSLAQKAALQYFTSSSLALCEARRAELIKRKKQVLAGLKQCGLSVPVHPDGAFYVYIDVGATGLSASEFCHRALHKAHVALTPGKDFGELNGERYVRLSYCSSELAIEQGLARLQKLVAEGL